MGYSVALIIIIVAITGFVTGRKSKKIFFPRSKSKLKDMRKSAKEALSDRTEKRKEKIIEMMSQEIVHQEQLAKCNLKKTKKGITNNDVEKLLDVSDSTAGRYLNELEAEGKIQQIGTSGRGIYYIPTKSSIV